MNRIRSRNDRNANVVGTYAGRRARYTFRKHHEVFHYSGWKDSCRARQCDSHDTAVGDWDGKSDEVGSGCNFAYAGTKFGELGPAADCCVRWNIVK